MEFIDKSQIMQGIGPDTTADLLEKSMGHKYFKREGVPGNYKYYYTEDEYKEAKGGQTEEKGEKRSDTMINKWIDTRFQNAGADKDKFHVSIGDGFVAVENKETGDVKHFNYTSSSTDSFENFIKPINSSESTSNTEESDIIDSPVEVGPSVKINGKDFKFDNYSMEYLSNEQRKDVVKMLEGGLFRSGRLPEAEDKVSIEPGKEYTVTQFSQTLSKNSSDTGKKRFIKDNINGYHSSYTNKKVSSEDIQKLITAVGDKGNIFNYFNKNYFPFDIELRDLGSIVEQTESNNIYTKMATDRSSIKELSFKLKVKYSEPPITLRTKILMSDTLSMRDIVNFM